MTHATVDLREVEQFLFREARLADEHQYEAWEALWTDDAVYWVPAGAEDSDPQTTMSVLFDNRNRISTRIKQLQTGRRHAQVPRSKSRRVLGNVELMPTDERAPVPSDLQVGANFVLVESRERGTQTWAGRCTYRLRRVDGDLRLSYKKVALVDSAFVLPTLSFLI